MATDLAEFIGAAIGINLLFGLPLFPSALLTGAAAFGILALQAYGFRRLEAVIAAFVGVIVVAFGLQTFLAEPMPGERRTRPLRTRLRGQGEPAARRRNPRRDGDAARHLPALGADPTSHRRRHAGGAQAHLPVRARRCRDRDEHRGAAQHQHARHRGGSVPRARPGRRRGRPVEGLRRPRTAPGLRCERDVRDRAARLGAVVLERGHDGRPDRDAGVRPAPDPADGAARGSPWCRRW